MIHQGVRVNLILSQAIVLLQQMVGISVTKFDSTLALHTLLLKLHNMVPEFYTYIPALQILYGYVDRFNKV